MCPQRSAHNLVEPFSKGHPSEMSEKDGREKSYVMRIERPIDKFIAAARIDDLDIIDEMLREKKVCIDEFGECQRTALMMAAGWDALNALNLLIRQVYSSSLYIKYIIFINADEGQTRRSLTLTERRLCIVLQNVALSHV